MKEPYFVTIIVPCRNEEKYIGKCINSIIGNDYPKNRLEVMVVDGRSEDRTRGIIKEYNQRYPFINLLDNYKKITSAAFNRGIEAAKGEIIMIMSAHSTYDKDYISKCVKYLAINDADNVGGVMITIPGADTAVSKAIALVVSHQFGVGNSTFRTGSKGPKWVDTVFGGCYKREVFDRIGFFDEDLVRNQDDEFNFRLIKNGGRILLVPEIVSYYYARDSLGKLWKMYSQYGYFKPLVAQKVGGVLTWRQIIPSLFIGSLITTGMLSFFSKYFLWFFLFIIGLYGVLDLSFSLIISIKNKDLKLLPFLMVSFATLHFSYGLSYLRGIWDFIIHKKHLKK